MSNPKNLETVDAVIDALGGNAVVKQLTRVNYFKRSAIGAGAVRCLGM